MLELYLGGARSGKSRLAEQRACASGRELVYIATATAGDAEMAARIAHHRQQRAGCGWQTVEAPEQLCTAIADHAGQDRCVLVDCLTLWLSNWLGRDDAAQWQRVRTAFLQCIQQQAGQLILVSNEVGQGVVPMGELTRRFVDEAGRLHQDIAAVADRVVFVTAGLEQTLKG
ncbi:bifunctional adenosylcobinamide kinase/adenosylcobinamide-phosphate guanylyltransferase [Spongiibacter sp.]|uniref:bifunctional adenosylcobinamide kinase/adenosylcobinamide-phosphate guanylyltransferase n=1 Tax=Spongiibacter sp. TaxID=2024860 RepID=UPI003569176C